MLMMIRHSKPVAKVNGAIEPKVLVAWDIPMKKDLIVAIFAPTGTSTTNGIFGTGYPVTDDLILTSRHVVKPENRNFRAPITVKCIAHKLRNLRECQAPYRSR